MKKYMAGMATGVLLSCTVALAVNYTATENVLPVKLNGSDKMKTFFDMFDKKRFFSVFKMIFLLLLFILTINSLDITYSRYESGAISNAKAKVAFYVVEPGTYEQSISLSGIIPSDDVYLYTGITSVVSDESNIGFILTNMRTKETTFYEIAGAEEYSAMASAEGQVQQMKYIASFPLLINFKGNPTYLLSLKDNAGLVKMYAFVDVKDYQKVVVTDSSKGIENAAQNYLSEIELINEEKLVEATIKIDEITSAVIDGNTYYYIIDDKEVKYKASIKINKDIIPFISKGDKLKVLFDDSTEIKEIIELNR